MAKEIREKKKNTTKKNEVNKTNEVSYFKGVKEELKKTSYPSFKDVLKYTLATIGVVILLALFFSLLQLLLSVVKGLFI